MTNRKTMEPTAAARAAEELVRRAQGAQGQPLTDLDGLLKQLTQTVLETALNEELAEYLGHDRHGRADPETGSARNGSRPRTVLTGGDLVQAAEHRLPRNGSRPRTVLTESTGQVQIDVPQDRAGTFEPQIVHKRQRRLTGVDQIVLSLYARGLTTGERLAWVLSALRHQRARESDLIHEAC